MSGPCSIPSFRSRENWRVNKAYLQDTTEEGDKGDSNVKKTQQRKYDALKEEESKRNATKFC